MTALSPAPSRSLGSLDAEQAALARVLESARLQHGLAVRLRATPGWSGRAERAYSARLDDLVAVLARGCESLEGAVSAAAAIGAAVDDD